MLGATVNAYSPHLRKSGSRTVVGELGESIDEALPLSHGNNEMKAATLPLTSTFVMPSPTFLWRFKVLLFLIWVVCCCKIGWDSVMRMNADLRDLFLYEAFLYYNPLLLVTLMVWLWGINLWVFSRSNVNYAKIFDLDQNHLTHWEIWKFATWMTIIVPTSMTAYIYLYSDGEVSLAASQPVILYIAAIMLLIFPFDIFYLSSRYYLLKTLWRIVLPLQAITFSDFFLADILTSMSKVATIAWFEADSVCGSHSVMIPLVLVLPYFFRLFQCLRQYKDTGEKSSLLNVMLSLVYLSWLLKADDQAFSAVLSFTGNCFLNLGVQNPLIPLKYSTAVPVIFLSALKYHVFPDKWTSTYRPLWLMSSVLNSMYSFYWDVTRDWDLSCFTRVFKFGKPDICSYLFHGRKWVYCWVIGSNLILRCTWTYKLSAHLRHNYLTVFTITALEIFRRFQWIFFRVENEWNKMSSKSYVQMSEDENSSDEAKLLISGNHDV